MKRLLAFLLLSVAALAQNTVQVTASNIAYGSTPLVSGTMLFQGVDASGSPIGYQLGGGGQQILYPVVCPITNGALAPNCYVANTAATNPLNVCMMVTVKDAFNSVVLGGTVASGYGCLQPAADNAWCSSGVCNFDQYIPNLVGIPIAKIPYPTATSLGGVFAVPCPSGLVMTGVQTTGLPGCVASSSTSFPSPPPLGNVTPNQVYGTTGIFNQYVQTITPGQFSLEIPPDPTNTCDYPAAYLIPGNIQLCTVGDGFLELNSGGGNFRVQTYRIPYQSLVNGAVLAYVANNADFEVGAPTTMTNAGVFANGQMNEYAQSLIGGCNPTTMWQAGQPASFATDAFLGCVSAPVGSAVAQVNGFNGLATSASTSTAAVGVYGFGLSGAAGVTGIGGSFLGQTTTGFTGTALGLRVAVNANNAGDAAYGISLGGTWGTQLTGTATAINLLPLNASNHWQNGLVFGANATANTCAGGGTCGAIVLGVSGTGANLDTQQVVFNSSNHSLTLRLRDVTNDLFFSGNVGVQGLVATYNNTATAGQGVDWMPCVTSQKSESGADAAVLTCAIPAAAGTYKLNFAASVFAANAATLGWTATWTDANGNLQTPTNLPLYQVGNASAGPAYTYTTSLAGYYYGSALADVNTGGTSIVVKFTFSGTSITSKATAWVERVI